MKKLAVVLLSLTAAVCVSVGVGKTTDTYTANAEETQVTFGKTAYKVSTDGQKMLLVTAMTNYSLVYEVGYEFTGYTVGADDLATTNKYYDTITTGGVSEDAGDIFGNAYEGYKLVIWEVAYTENVTFNAYAKEGETDGENLVIPEIEKKTTGTPRTNAKYEITFANDDGTELQKSTYFDGQTPTYTGATPTKATTYECKYTFNGWNKEIGPATETTTYTATYDTYYFQTSTDGTTHTLGFDSDRDYEEYLGANDSQEWLATYEGGKGVAKMTASTSVWTGYYFNFGSAVETLRTADWNYVAVKLLVSGSTGDLKVNYEYNDGSWDQLPTIASITAGEWTEVKFYKSDIEKYGGLENFYARLDGDGKFFNLSNATGNLYVDYIDVVEYQTSTDGTTHTVGFDHEREASKVKGKDNSISVAWESEVNGAKGVIGLTGASNAYNDLCCNLGLTTAQLSEKDWNCIEARVYFEGTSSNGKVQMYYMGGWREWYELNTWVNVRLYKTAIGSQVTDGILNGSSYLFESQNATLTHMYVDYIDIVEYQTSTDGTTHTVAFDTDKDYTNYLGSNATQEWLATHEGAKGVVKLTSSDNTWTGFKFKLGVTADELEGKNIVIRMYVETTATQSNHEGQFQVMNPSYGGWFDADQWITVTIPASNYSDIATMLSGGARLFGTLNATVTCVYVDYIDVVAAD